MALLRQRAVASLLARGGARCMRTVPNVVNGRVYMPDDVADDVDPSTGKVIAHVGNSATADAVGAIEGAAEAFERSGWATKSYEERAVVISNIGKAILARRDEFAEVESGDTGKPLSVARTLDIDRVVRNFDFFAGYATHAVHNATPVPTGLNYTQTKPLGVVSLITPWNLPLYLLTWKLAPALMMGNACVAKPATNTPSSASLLAEVCIEAGLPPGLFNVVQGRGALAGDTMCTHPLVKAVSFTGGTETGRSVAASASASFKKVSLELGGKNPTVVFADADIEKAAATAVRAAFLNSGQICLCGSRILVQREAYDEFRERFVAHTRAWKCGDPRDPETKMGPVISEAHHADVSRYIEIAKSEGGEILHGGGAPPADLSERCAGGFFLAPTVVDGLRYDATVAQEEVFGPLASLHSFEDEDDAVMQANSTQYGLACSLWTSDVGRAHRVAQRIDSGMVWVNNWMVRHLSVPFGGFKDSGLGREGGMHSLRFFSEDKNIYIDYGSQ